MNKTSSESVASEQSPQFSTTQTFYTPEVKYIKKSKKRRFANTLKMFFSLLLLVCLFTGSLYTFTYFLPTHEVSQQIGTYIPFSGLHKQTKNALTKLQLKNETSNTKNKTAIAENTDSNIPDTTKWDSLVYPITFDTKKIFGLHIKNGWIAFNKKDINLCTDGNTLKGEISIENSPIAIDAISFLPYSPFAFIKTNKIKSNSIDTASVAKGDVFTLPYEKPLDRLYPSFVSTNKRSFVSAETDSCFKSNYLFEGYLLNQSKNPGLLVNKNNELLGLTLVQGEEVGLVDYQTLAQEIELLEKKQLFNPMFSYTLESTQNGGQLVVNEIMPGASNIDLDKGDVINQINNQPVSASTIKFLYQQNEVTLSLDSAKKVLSIKPQSWSYDIETSKIRFAK